MHRLSKHADDEDDDDDDEDDDDDDDYDGDLQYSNIKILLNPKFKKLS